MVSCIVLGEALQSTCGLGRFQHCSHLSKRGIIGTPDVSITLKEQDARNVVAVPHKMEGLQEYQPMSCYDVPKWAWTFPFRPFTRFSIFYGVLSFGLTDLSPENSSKFV